MKEVSKGETPMEVMASQYLGLEATEEQMVRREPVIRKALPVIKPKGKV